jgi:uncharacterized protein YggU (UPF0235/DUF167 family)
MSGTSARFRVRVTPKSRADQVGEALADGRIRVRVRAAAEGGRANEAVVALLAGALGLPRAAVRIAGGHGSRDKWIEAEGLTSEEAVRRLGGAK